MSEFAGSYRSYTREKGDDFPKKFKDVDGQCLDP
jgi:hypothetical protein